ncbi:2-hydroxy-3-oxopropionate reductase [Arthrobacter sp. SRS-W-1-2016]|uniref:NAD(P)-dependent oxidoreductase n=1 Tax=Arthrobacter sp. SRS-W-1-2016 TaxID=1930254 RepID=UPI000990A49F|nr:NAD(P)-dependent oxidoreductase [Arthrobacter sp. SRS-W-1-2016]OOP63081.1 2-hydroxy-3-oxopropionate reductase [Arthrobacter sp. SRS-W-1-2016]
MGPIGFIGVGAMGASIASRLVGKFELLVNDRNESAADDLVRAGAKFASPEEIAAKCRVVMLCLPAPKDVTGLLLGPDGLVNQIVEGTVVVDMTTSSPTADIEVEKALRARKASFADAAIAGGVRRARAGTAVLMVGADQDVFDRIKDLLFVVTSDAIHVGTVGTGHAMKLVNNLLNNCNRFAALESIRLGQDAGLERDVIIEVLNKSSGRNYTTEYTYPQLLSGDTYLPQGFTLGLMLKDLQLANELADTSGHGTPIGHLVQTFTEQAVERFGSTADQSQLMAEWYDGLVAPAAEASEAVV